MPPRSRNILAKALRRVSSEIGRRRADRLWKRWQKTEQIDADVRFRRTAPIVEASAEAPTISILLPVYNISEDLLRRCISSVRRQSYTKWQLCIADDASNLPHVRAVLTEAAQNDSRIASVFRGENGNISAASNTALDLATGEFCALLDHDDELAPHALFELASAIIANPSTHIIYSDEDKIDEQGRRTDPVFKPDWSRDFFYSNNYLNHLTAIRTSLIRQVGGFRMGYEGSQDYDLLLRCIEQIDDDQIAHIPKILYHWRAIPGSIALAGSEKQFAHNIARRALAEHFERTGVDAEVVEAIHNRHRVRYSLPSQLPSVVIVSKANATRLDRIAAMTAYPNFNIVEAGDRKFDADVLCFLGEAIEPVRASWLDELVQFALQDQIGCVGAKIVKEGLVHDGAYVVGTDEIASAAHHGLPEYSANNALRNLLIGNFSAVSAACMVTRRELFDSLGGFDSASFPTLTDIDYCLRARELGLRVVFAADVEMNAAEASGRRRPSEYEADTFRRRWPMYFEHGDPFHNPNLDRRSGSFDLAAPSRRARGSQPRQ